MTAKAATKLSEEWPVQSLRCHYHKDQTVQNFCACDSCLLPLCPKCIKAHTDDHCDRSICPNIETISQTIQSVEGEIREDLARISKHISLLKQYNSQRYVKMVQEELSRAKKEALAELESYFAKAEGALVADAKNRVDEFYDTTKGKVDQLLVRHSHQLKEYMDGLSKHSLSTLIKYLSSDQHHRMLALEQTLKLKIHTIQNTLVTVRVNKESMIDYLKEIVQISFGNIPPVTSVLDQTISFRNRGNQGHFRSGSNLNNYYQTRNPIQYRHPQIQSMEKELLLIKNRRNKSIYCHS